MKATVATAAIEAMRLRGEPLTPRQTLEAILEFCLYSFGTAKPIDVVRRELKRHCASTKGRPEPDMEEHPGKRYFFRKRDETNAANGAVEEGQPRSRRSEPEATERITIIRAIRQVMAKRSAAMTVEEVYATIVREGLYQFKASEPIHVVRSQIRRHSLGIDFPTASETKHFEFKGRGKYSVLKVAVKRKSRLSHIGVAPEEAALLKRGPRARSLVFVSYSHRDEKWMQRLQVHLAPLEREGRIVRWDDTQIRPGGKWRTEIDAALDRAQIAILLVSADFLASQFIIENELPPLLKGANTQGVIILPVIVSACRFKKSDLAQFQAMNPPEKPLNSLPKPKCEEIFVQVADAVESALYAEG